MFGLTILVAVVAATAPARADDSNFRPCLIVSYGAGHDVAPNRLDFSDLVVTRSTQRYAYVFIASSYEL